MTGDTGADESEQDAADPSRPSPSFARIIERDGRLIIAEDPC
jgi:hypothetical protein